jgi:hypothetical protein
MPPDLMSRLPVSADASRRVSIAAGSRPRRLACAARILPTQASLALERSAHDAERRGRTTGLPCVESGGARLLGARAARGRRRRAARSGRVPDERGRAREICQRLCAHSAVETEVGAVGIGRERELCAPAGEIASARASGRPARAKMASTPIGVGPRGTTSVPGATKEGRGAGPGESARPGVALRERDHDLVARLCE